MFTLLAALVLGAVSLLPTTPRASKSFHYSVLLKDSLLAHADAPRMIFIGGSNISFGLNSQMVKDSLSVNPINTGINARLGLKFMLDHAALHAKRGDVIVAPLEYIHFTSKYSTCGEPLLRVAMDVRLPVLSLLSFQQAVTLLPHVPRYIFSKLNPFAYFHAEVDPPYSANSFNRYGDECAHWSMERRLFTPTGRLDDFNPKIVEHIKDFEKIMEEKGARLYLAYPSYLDKSFYQSEDIIAAIRAALEKNFKVLGTPQRYMMPDSLMFDSSYHLNKKGVDIRTARLIEDIKSANILHR